MAQRKKSWETNDISLATFLALCLNIDPEFEWNLDLTSCVFVFPRSDALVEHVANYVSGEALVEPKSYHIRASKLRLAMFGDRKAIRAEAL